MSRFARRLLSREVDVLQTHRDQLARRAADSLRLGSRVVTLASPLRHAAFHVESVVPCFNSWGEEDAYVNVLGGAGEAAETSAHSHP